MREKSITLRGIDSLFAVVEDPTYFYSKELFTKAKIAAVMALATWYVSLDRGERMFALISYFHLKVDSNRFCLIASFAHGATFRGHHYQQ